MRVRRGGWERVSAQDVHRQKDSHFKVLFFVLVVYLSVPYFHADCRAGGWGDGHPGTGYWVMEAGLRSAYTVRAALASPFMPSCPQACPLHAMCPPAAPSHAHPAPHSFLPDSHRPV